MAVAGGYGIDPNSLLAFRADQHHSDAVIIDDFKRVVRQLNIIAVRIQKIETYIANRDQIPIPFNDANRYASAESGSS